MKLTKEQSDLFKSKIKTIQDIEIKCPICRSTDFEVLDNEYQLISFDRDHENLSVDMSNITYTPLLAITCKNCGHVDFYNRIAVLGELNK